MITAIDQTHPLFSCADYIKDSVAFIVLESIKQNPLLLLSNGKDFIIGRSAPLAPIWIWTSDLISETTLTALCSYCFSQFNTDGSVSYIAKPTVASQLALPYITHRHATLSRLAMQSFENPKVIPPKNQQIVIEKPTELDLHDISSCLSHFAKDCFDTYVPADALLEKAKIKLGTPGFFVIKQNGTVVAIAQRSIETPTHISINGVYTKPEYRGRGFAGALVASISAQILAQGKIPTLYTDLSNPASNKTYKNIGFIEKGKVDEVTLTWG